VARVNALFEKAWQLDSAERLDDAIAAYDELIARFKADTNPEVRNRVTNALLYKAYRVPAANSPSSPGARS
jgi:hypothetical protein